MNPRHGIGRNPSLLPNRPLALLLAAGVLQLTSLRAAPNVVVWDTVAPLSDTADGRDRSAWKAVPVDLLQLEANPPKASSDPGYYGREYGFSGDMVVESPTLAGVFRTGQARVALYSRAAPAPTDPSASKPAGFGHRILELAPLLPKERSVGLRRFAILRNGGDDVAVEAVFASPGAPETSIAFSLGKSGIAEIKPGANPAGLRLVGAIDHAVAPGFITDDLVFGAAEAPAPDSLAVPAENLLLGLLEGGNDEFVLSWPKGNQRVGLGLGKEAQGRRPIESVEFEADGQSLYVAALSAPGIWHREPLKPSLLEKDTAIGWKRPFPARWKTQLLEEGVPTTFAFREAKGEIWRGVPGSYAYPVWFAGDEAMYRLGKKVPPKGESLVYFLEGQGTPQSVVSPFEFMQATLGRPASDPILDLAGRRLRTHHRRGADGVRRACTCGCTEAIQTWFEAGEETSKIREIREALDDMRYFVEHHVGRIGEYRRFADDLVKYLRAQAGATPGMKSYIEGIEAIALEIPREYEVQKENMGSAEQVDRLTDQTLALAGKKDAGNLKAYMELLKAWRAMGGAQDYVVARCHMITRKLAQEAGYASARRPETVALAMGVRARCRQILRNPDGYEIWADY